MASISSDLANSSGAGKRKFVSRIPAMNLKPVAAEKEVEIRQEAQNSSRLPDVKQTEPMMALLPPKPLRTLEPDAQRRNKGNSRQSSPRQDSARAVSRVQSKS